MKEPQGPKQTKCSSQRSEVRMTCTWKNHKPSKTKYVVVLQNSSSKHEDHKANKKNQTHNPTPYHESILIVQQNPQHYYLGQLVCFRHCYLDECYYYLECFEELLQHSEARSSKHELPSIIAEHITLSTTLKIK